jgi:hypothetical protein
MKAASIAVVVSLLLPTTARAARDGASAICSAAPPNGVDDTANLQAALDACVARGPRAAVQLAAGRYLTRQLVTYGLHGTLTGMGTDRTIVEALPNLRVTLTDAFSAGECLPNTTSPPDPTSCLWPTLIIFVDGDIHVSDLSIQITPPAGTRAVIPNDGWPFRSLLDAIRFMGHKSMHVTIDRIAIRGQPDNSGFGFSLVNGIIFTGELPRSSTPFDYYFLSGSLTVRSSSFTSMFDGVSQDGFMQDAQVTIGGSPTASNVFNDVFVGIDLESSQNSVFEVSHNHSSSSVSGGNGMWVIPWPPPGPPAPPAFVPATPSHYFIHHNTFTPTADFQDGILLFNYADNPWIRAVIYNNTIDLNELSEGIGAYNVKGAAILGNTITGRGSDVFALTAIGFHGTTFSSAIANDVSGFTPPPDLAQIFLDPGATHDLVVCSSRGDSVLDQGSSNIVVGCQQQAATAKSAATTGQAAPLSPPDLLKWKLGAKLAGRSLNSR